MMAAHENTQAIGTWDGSEVRKPSRRVRTLARPRGLAVALPKGGRGVLGVGIDRVYDACANKSLRHVKLGHSTIRTRKEWVNTWAETHAR